MKAGIWNGETLRLWSLDTQDTAPQDIPCQAGLETALEAHTPMILAGAPATARGLPCKPLPDALQGSPTHIPPLSQDSPLTVTNGEEVAIAGFIALHPKFDGILCLPTETSTLWVHVSAEEVVSMRRVLTGALVSALFTEGLSLKEIEPFKDALSDTMSRPEMAALRLGSLQVETTQHRLDTPEAASRASAALIGAELAATRAYWLGQPVALIGSARLRAPYRVALESQFVPLTEVDETAMYHAGFAQAKDRITA